MVKLKKWFSMPHRANWVNRIKFRKNRHTSQRTKDPNQRIASAIMKKLDLNLLKVLLIISQVHRSPAKNSLLLREIHSKIGNIH